MTMRYRQYGAKLVSVSAIVLGLGLCFCGCRYDSDAPFAEGGEKLVKKQTTERKREQQSIADQKEGQGRYHAYDWSACARSIETARNIKLNLFMSIDRSSSMSSSAKWANAKLAFTDFFRDDAADAMSVALRFWPDESCEQVSCDVTSCGTPLIELGSLQDPSHEDALIAAFEATRPSGGTPLSAALAGAARWAMNRGKLGVAGERNVVLLLTDGRPTQCEEDFEVIAGYASEAYQFARALTFVVGFQGAVPDGMHQIAEAGRTGESFVVENEELQTSVLALLAQIQERTLTCSLALPTPVDSDVQLAFDEVNVTMFDSTMGVRYPLVMVPDAAGCDQVGFAWYYEEPDDPQAIHLCPRSCQVFQQREGRMTEMIVGCKTIDATQVWPSYGRPERIDIATVKGASII